MENYVKDGNYYVVQSFMVKDLKLKGNKLTVYAIIYGFSQTQGQTFTGSLQYLADWTNSSKQSILNCLKSLCDKGFIEKIETSKNGVKFCEYKSLPLFNKVEYPIQQSLMGGSQQSLPNNIEYNNIDNKIDKKENEDGIPVVDAVSYSNSNNIFKKPSKEEVEEVIKYLNEKAGTRFGCIDSNTKEIKARFAENYKLEDFRTVIDKKCKEWLGTEQQKYLRPETLFCKKHFDGYLNSLSFEYKKSMTSGRDYSDKELNSLVQNIDEIEI